MFPDGPVTQTKKREEMYITRPETESGLRQRAELQKQRGLQHVPRTGRRTRGGASGLSVGVDIYVYVYMCM